MMTNLLKKIIKKAANLSGIDIRRLPSYEADNLLYTQPASERQKFVNIGSGDFYHPHWTNLDFDNDCYRELQSKTTFIPYDLTQMAPMPFEAESVDIFYTSHTIEHLNNDCAQYLFEEVYRCLRPEGVFRVTCPDMEIQYRAYARGDSSFWPQPSPWNTNLSSIADRFMEHFATILVGVHRSRLNLNDTNLIDPDKFDSLFSSLDQSAFFDELTKSIPSGANSFFPGGHSNWFTFEKIKKMLNSAGFKHIYRSGFGQSVDPKLRRTDLFDSTCPELSIYVEAIK